MNFVLILQLTIKNVTQYLMAATPQTAFSKKKTDALGMSEKGQDCEPLCERMCVLKDFSSIVYT